MNQQPQQPPQYQTPPPMQGMPNNMQMQGPPQGPPPPNQEPGNEESTDAGLLFWLGRGYPSMYPSYYSYTTISVSLN